MNLLNQPLAWGALAFAIPLILHILNRSRFRRIEWGAMHLLESVVLINHKRFRIEQLILLLVRCAIPALLAFCLARPVLTGAQMLTGDAPVSLVILLDTSYSMDATNAGVPRFHQAIDSARKIVEATARGSEVAVIQTGGSPTPMFDEPIFDSAAVVRRLQTLQAGYGASDMQQALDAGLATLAGMSHGRRELVVISDFQSADWPTTDWDAGGSIAESIRQQVAALPVPPEVSLLQVGETVRGNVSIESLDFSQRPLGVGQQLSVRANLRNYGETPIDNARITLNIDGAEQAISQVTLTGNGSSQTLLPCRFETPGSHVIEVQVDVDDDPLPDDNRYAAAVTIWEAIDVLLVDGAPSSQALKGETDFLAVALTPYSFGRVKLSDLVQTTKITPDQLQPEMLASNRVVVLANVPRLNDAQTEALRQYVGEGGSLLVFAGSGIDAKWYNEKLFAGGSGLLPAQFGSPQGELDGKNETDSSQLSARIVAQHFDHPALEFFNDAANGDLSTARIRRWYDLQPAETVAADDAESTEPDDADVRRSGPVVVAQLDNGAPLLVERAFGEGTVMQVATACDADWSDLPLRPVFVPLMQQLVTTLATQLTPPRNIRTGEPAVALISEQPASSTNTDTPEIPTPQNDEPLSITTPDGGRRTLRTVPQGSGRMARFDATQRPGVYTITSPQGAAIHFVATTSRSESDLAMLDDPQLASLAEGIEATVVASPEELLEADRLRRHGREIWRYVLMGLLAFMFLELVLQQRFARVQT